MDCLAGKGNDRSRRGDVHVELSPAVVASNQDGEHSVCEGLASDLQDSTESHRGGISEMRHNSSSSQYQKTAEELPRLNFQIPRKNKEKRVLFQYVSSESREFTEISKILTSNYKDASSTGTFLYSTPRLVHSEHLEKEFIEKRRELKQDGRTEKELTESYCFLLCDAFKLQWICEKGLSVGHSWMNILGHSSKGVYLCKYSDLIQINTFDLGATGEIIIFKVIKGKVKSIYENMSKNLDPTPKFDSHFSKKASTVTSLLSFRAFEFTQQYFYEYTDFEIRSRPRHVCPYAVLSFQFKGKEATAVPKPMPPLRSNSQPSVTGTSSYTVWRGQLVNGGKEVYQVCLRSFSQPMLPFKLPDKIEIGKVMSLDQVTQKVPPALFSWSLYSGSHEVFKRGLHCSLFEVVDRSKPGDSLAELLQKLEQERLVLVNTMIDSGFLILLSSAQMANPNERRGGWINTCLQALFIFPESRDVVKYSTVSKPPEPLLPVPQDPVMPSMDSFIPALHYALNKVRCNPPADLNAGVERQARDYLNSNREGKLLQRVRIEYDHKLDEREKLFPAPRQKFNWEGYLRSYIYGPNLYMVPVVTAKDMVESFRCVPEYSPVSDWEASDGQASEGKPNGLPGAQSDEDPEKMKELLKLIQLSKKSSEGGRQPEKGQEERGKEGAREAHSLKRKVEQETKETGIKCPRRASLNNGEHREEELQPSPSLAEVISSVGLHDTDLRKDKSQGALKLMKMLDTLNKSATVSSTGAFGSDSLEGKTGAETRESTESTEETLYDSMIKLGLPTNRDIDLRKQFVDDNQDQEKNDYLEEETAGSMSSLEAFSPCSDTNGQHRGVEMLGERSIPWVLIPITGLKSERYCQRQEDNPQDPRFLQSPAVSNHNTPEKKTPPSEPLDTSYTGTALSQPPDSSYTGTALSQQPDRCYTETALSQQPDRSYTGTALSQPPDSSYTGTALSQPPDSSYTGTALSQQPDRCYTETALSQQPDRSYTGTALSQPPDSSYTGTALSQPPDSSYTGTALSQPPDSSYTRTALSQPPSNSYLKTALSELPDSSYIEAALSQPSDRNNTGMALSQLPSNSYLKTALSELPDSSYIEAALSQLPGSSYLKTALPEPPDSSYTGTALSEPPDSSYTGTALSEPPDSSYTGTAEPPDNSNTEATLSQLPGSSYSEATLSVPPDSSYTEAALSQLPGSSYTEAAFSETPDSSYMEAQQVEKEDDTNLTDELKSHCQDQRALLNGVDSIVDEQLCDFSDEMMDLLRGHHVYYNPHAATLVHKQPLWTPMTPFSEYVSHFNTPLPLHSYVGTLRDDMSLFIDSHQSNRDGTAPVLSVLQSPVYSSALDPIPSDVPSSVPIHTTMSVTTSSSIPAVKTTSLTPSFHPRTHPLIPCSSPPQSQPPQLSLPRLGTCKEVHLLPQTAPGTEGHRQSEVNSVKLERQEGRGLFEYHQGSTVSETNSDVHEASPLGTVEGKAHTEMLSDTAAVEPAPASLSSLISQLKPEMISSLVEIIKGVQKNTVHFYIHAQEDEEESDVCWEIKEYLQKLGNAECNPQSFLEKRNHQDKLLIIIQNVDIAAQVHKIPALVSLKKLPSVSFAGVDSLDDIKNHTYNELFVSGGFIVSDEFVLNPDFITQERLQAFLQLLEQLNTSESLWRWKVHCKTHKRLKEQSRLKSDALNLLNLLTTYQKRHIVEFLPYHECDAPMHQAPDLDCLVKLQAQHIQHRHIIFLTERRFEMFPHYSSNGIVIANIDDIMNSFGSLVGFHDHNEMLPSVDKQSPTTLTLLEEDVSLDSEDNSMVRTGSILQGGVSVGMDHQPLPLTEPTPPIPDQLVLDRGNPVSLPSPSSELGMPKELDFDALKSAISQFKATQASRMQLDADGVSPGGFNVNPHQSFLSLGSLPASYPCSSECNDPPSLPASPFRGLRARDIRPAASAPLPACHSPHPVSQEELRPTLQPAETPTSPCQAGLGSEEVPMEIAMDSPVPLYRSPDTGSIGIGDVTQGGTVASTVEPVVPDAMVTPGTSYVTSENHLGCTNTSHTTPTSPNDSACAVTDSHLDKSDSGNSASETAIKQEVVASPLSCSTQVEKKTATSINQGSILPVPRGASYSMGNTVDRMMMQGSGLWPTSEGHMGLSGQGLGLNSGPLNGAMGLRPTMMNSTMGVVGPAGFRGLMPNNMGWGGFAQGGAPSIWGMQHSMGLGQVHRAQFIQSYAWRGNPTFQGNSYPPHRGGYNGW